MLELYHGSTSVCAVKVRLVLAEKSLDWTGHLLNLQAGDQQHLDYLRLNPNGVVPTLVHDGHVIIESSVIIAYLDEAFPDPPLQPVDPLERARMRLWMKQVDEALHPACSIITFATANRKALLRRSPESLEEYFRTIPDPAARQYKRESVEQGLEAPKVAEGIRLFDRTLQRMEDTLAESPWLAGTTYSLADISLTPYVNRLDALGLSRMWEGTRPRLTDWFARVRARPSFEQATTPFLSSADIDRFTLPFEEVWEKARKALQQA